MSGEKARRFNELKADISERGIQDSIDVRVERDGRIHIANGTHRLLAAEELGIKDAPVMVTYRGGSDVEHAIFELADGIRPPKQYKAVGPVGGAKPMTEGTLYQSGRGLKPPVSEPKSPREAAAVAVERVNKFKETGLEAIATLRKGEFGEAWKPVAEKVAHRILSDLNALRKYGGGLYEEGVLQLGSKAKAYRIAVNNMRWAFKPIRGMRDKVEWVDGTTATPMRIVSEVTAARRAREIGEGAGPFWKEGHAQKILDTFESLHAKTELGVKIEETAARLYDVNDKLLMYWVKKGVLSEKAYQRIRKSSDFYMPFHRVLKRQQIAELEASGQAGQAKSLKKFVGSDLEINDVIENMATNYIDMIPAADRHALMARVIDSIDSSKKSRVTEFKKGMGMVEKNVVDEDGISQSVKEYFMPKTEVGAKDIAFMRNGKWETWRIEDQQLLDMVKKSYNAEGIWVAGKALKNMKRAGVTLNPVFMGRNALRDFTTRLMNDEFIGNTMADQAMFLPKVAWKAAVEFPIAALEVIAGSNPAIKKQLQKFASTKNIGELFESLEIRGAMGSSFHPKNVGDMKRLIGEAAGLKVTDPKIVANPFKWMEAVASVIEQTPRIDAARSVMKRNTAAVKAGTMSAEQSKREAALMYRRITADFGQMGTLSKGKPGQVSPFFSAQFAGMKSEWEAVKQQKAWWFGKAGQLVGLTAALWQMNHDKDWYKGLDGMSKNMYWHLGQTDDGTIIKIPKGYGATSLAVNTIERILDGAFDDDPNAFKEWGEATKLSMPSLPLPTMVSGPVGMFMNKDIFFGSDIEGRFDRGAKDKYLISKPSTTALAKYLGQPFKDEWGLSPAQIDFIAREFGGGVGSLGMKGVSAMMTEGEGHVKPERHVSQIPGAAAVTSRDPNTTTYSSHVADFYDNFDRTKRKYTSFKAAREEGDVENARRLLEDSGHDIRKYKRLSKYRTAMKKINDQIKELRKSTTEFYKGARLTPEIKTNKLEMLTREFNRLAAAANEEYQQGR